MTGSSLIALGLTWRQALAAIIVGNVISTALVILNSLPGAYYHRKRISLSSYRELTMTVGFPLANRYVWGLWGSYFVLLNRILLSLGEWR
jgi:NCS1 family nucleobase:cation symporter-1